MQHKTWLFSRPTDLLVLGLPVWATWLVCFLVPASLLETEVPLWFWVVFILGIDVSHVWSTVFRTYFDKEEFTTHKRLLVLTPVICLAICFLAAAISTMLFWTLLAYMALYHFIKQQYGFMQLYRARYGFIDMKKRVSDKTIIYWSMLYPVLYWHLNTERNFSWFVEGDFFNFRTLLAELPFWSVQLHDQFMLFGNAVYFLLIGYWLVEELVLHARAHLKYPLGKIIWVLTTAGNWYLGIVHFNSDFAFSLTNVVAHGIPYLALIFFYVERKKQVKGMGFNMLRTGLNVSWMLMFVLVLALGEEYLWDMWIYRENQSFFESFIRYPMGALQHPLVQAFGLAILSLPQVTHYVLDGFIWKANQNNPYVRKTLLT